MGLGSPMAVQPLLLAAPGSTGLRVPLVCRVGSELGAGWEAACIFLK